MRASVAPGACGRKWGLAPHAPAVCVDVFVFVGVVVVAGVPVLDGVLAALPVRELVGVTVDARLPVGVCVSTGDGLGTGVLVLAPLPDCNAPWLLDTAPVPVLVGAPVTEAAGVGTDVPELEVDGVQLALSDEDDDPLALLDDEGVPLSHEHTRPASPLLTPLPAHTSLMAQYGVFAEPCHAQRESSAKQSPHVAWDSQLTMVGVGVGVGGGVTVPAGDPLGVAVAALEPVTADDTVSACEGVHDGVPVVTGDPVLSGDAVKAEVLVVVDSADSEGVCVIAGVPVETGEIVDAVVPDQDGVSVVAGVPVLPGVDDSAGVLVNVVAPDGEGVSVIAGVPVGTGDTVAAVVPVGEIGLEVGVGDDPCDVVALARGVTGGDRVTDAVTDCSELVAVLVGVDVLDEEDVVDVVLVADTDAVVELDGDFVVVEVLDVDAVEVGVLDVDRVAVVELVGDFVVVDVLEVDAVDEGVLVKVCVGVAVHDGQAGGTVLGAVATPRNKVLIGAVARIVLVLVAVLYEYSVVGDVMYSTK